MSTNPGIRNIVAIPQSQTPLPALFIGHGSPTNAIEDTEFSRAWAEVGASLPKPRAVLCVSAHWETAGTCVTAMEKPRTIHDFYGFPPALHAMEYPAPGCPELADEVRALVRGTAVEPDSEWGLDHGAWAVLCRMFPEADVPVVQLSLDKGKAPAFHHALGRELGALRRKGVLVIGSGNIVHNLREMTWEDTAYDWARAFDARIAELILTRDYAAVIDYHKLGRDARLSVPTNEHFLPLLYVLGMQEAGEGAAFFANKVTLGSMSMRSVRIG
jgi:4,5-DOPA dioxygenase extradiol